MLTTSRHRVEVAARRNVRPPTLLHLWKSGAFAVTMKREVSVPKKNVRSSFVAAFSLVLSLAHIAAAEGPAYQVADIAPNTPARNQGGWVYPSYFQPVTGADVFLAPAGAGVPSIWRTDGTPEGTRPVAAGAVIGNGALIGSNGQRAYFAAAESTVTNAVWATDGTPGGTVLLKAGLRHPVPASFDPEAVVVEGRLFFHDCNPAPFAACDLWTSDGTLEGTRKLAEIGHQATRVSGSGGVAYFLSETVDTFQPVLWRTDGTAGGTIRLRTFSNVGSTDLASVGGRALVVAEGKLWATNGNAVDPIATPGSNQAINFQDAAREGDALYFLAEPFNGATTLTVWRSDGTAAGTSTVLSTSIAFSPVMAYPWVQRHGSRVYYLVPGPQGGEPHTLWSSDAGGQGAQPVTCGGCSSIPFIGWIQVAGGDLFFPAAAGDVHTLWAIDSSHVPRAVSTHCTGYCRTEPAQVVDDRAMFLVSPTLGSYELWVTDGSAAGTQSVGSFASFASLYASANLDGVLFGASPELLRQADLWMSRGTPQSTVPLTAVEGNGSEARELRQAGERVVLLACREPQGLWGAGPHEAELVREGGVDCFSTSGFYPLVSAGDSAFFEYAQFSGQSEVWATDGTAASTRKVWDNAVDGGFVRDMVAFGGDLVFWTYRFAGNQLASSLWRSDGTLAGTTKSLDLPAGVGPGEASTALGGELYFLAQSPPLQIFQVWRTDGTAAGTRRLTNEPLGEFLQNPEFTRVVSFVYFTGDHGIWRTNGTTAGTALAIPGPQDGDAFGDGLTWLHEQGGALLFMRTENGVSTLWRTQGTPASTQQIAALRAITGPLRSAASFNGRLYFAADDGSHGVELWRTDGTAAGTVLVRDIGLGPTSGNPRELVVANGRLYFTADDLFAGSELWVSDGSAAGTRMVQDIAPHAASSSPADLTVVDDLLYFSADDAVTGRELWALPLAQPTVCTPGDERLCLSGGRFQVEVTWQDFAGNTGRGTAVPLTTDTGYFWFFDAANVELTLKVLDGRGVNGHHWVFYGALSSVEYVVTVTDTETGVVKTYLNPSGILASVADTSAFRTGSATIAGATRTPTHHADSSPAGVLSGPCVASSSRLCLQGGRFAVEAAWTDFAGNSGTGTAVRLTGDTGYFWFFGESNVEVVLKVLDGRPVNGKFWVFYGALSSVQYTLTVTDTETGLQKQYHNPSGRLASIADTSAF